MQHGRSHELFFLPHCLHCYYSCGHKICIGILQLATCIHVIAQNNSYAPSSQHLGGKLLWLESSDATFISTEDNTRLTAKLHSILCTHNKTINVHFFYLGCRSSFLRKKKKYLQFIATEHALTKFENQQILRHKNKPFVHMDSISF